MKDKILETAMSLFVKKGIRAVKMDDIANMLSISKRTLYEVYSDKEHLLYEGIRMYQDRNHEQMKEIAARSSNVMDVILQAYKLNMESFKETAPVFFDDLEKYPAIREYFEKEKKNTRTQFVDFLRRGIEERYFRDGINLELIAHMFDAQGKYVMSAQLYRHYPMDEIWQNLVLVSLRGICTAEGVKVLDAFLFNETQV
ncbi:MAG: TetR/AcrR family transcriptional regulator [Prevotella sp.]|nr:TetR/AcrR family transcriptional regulator [Prevotella sp.]